MKVRLELEKRSMLRSCKQFRLSKQNGEYLARLIFLYRSRLETYL